jgi:hypothetical protein
MINNAFETVEITLEHIPTFLSEQQRLDVLSRLSKYIAQKVEQNPLWYHVDVDKVQMPIFNVDETPTLRLVTLGDSTNLRDFTQTVIAEASLQEYKKAS